MILPISSGCTVTSRRIEPEFSILLTETSSVRSTKDLTSNSNNSFKEPLPFILRPLPYPATHRPCEKDSLLFPKVVLPWLTSPEPSPCPQRVRPGWQLDCNNPGSR